MKEHFVRFFLFNNWANKAIADSLIENNIQDEQVLLLFSHLTLAQRNWYFRVIGEQNDVPIWTSLPPASIASQLDENGGLWLSYLNSLQEADLQTAVAYKSMAGDPFLDTLSDVLTHLVNHSTYHRGQIIYLIRQLGITPPGTDYIVFARQFRA